MNARNSSFPAAWAAFGCMLAAFFFPVVFQHKVLAPLDILEHLMRPWADGACGFGVHNAFVYDAVSQYIPYNWSVFQSLRHDGFIGWNPDVYGGCALLENTMLCPGDWHHQLYRFLDFWSAWDLGIVLQFAIAGAGMLVMLREEGSSALAALAGATAFAFCSQHVIWVYHRWVLASSCWFPWIVWSVRRSLRARRWFDLPSAVFTALALRSGSLQTCLFAAALLLCIFFAEWWRLPARWKPATVLGAAMPFATIAVLSSIFAADVLASTIPPYIAGCRALPRKSFAEALLGLPTLVTSLDPAFLGAPGTLDGMKAFGCELFDVKYAGAIPFVLAVPALLRKTVPLLPKLLFSAGLAIPFTPLTHWFYSRSTVLFALGCAWLAACTLSGLPRSMPDRAWRILSGIGVAVFSSWLAAGTAVAALAPRIAPRLHSFVERSLPPDRASRLDWMSARADAWLARFPVWHPQNLVPFLLVALGLFAAWRFSRPTRNRAWAAVLVLCTFGEMFLWSRLWLTFSDKPESPDSPYPDRAWIADLKREMDGGGYLWIDGERPAFDYFQLNSQSVLGIPALQGYETIRPATLRIPGTPGAYEPAAFADAGVSHVLVMPGAAVPDGLAGWIECIDTPELRLFRNPAFDSRWHARLADGSSIPIADGDPSPNRHRFDLPEGTVELVLAEPFNGKWTAEPSWSRMSAASRTRTEIGGMSFTLDGPSPAGGVLAISFDSGRHLLPAIQLAVLAAAFFVSKSALLCGPGRHGRKHEVPVA